MGVKQRCRSRGRSPQRSSGRTLTRARARSSAARRASAACGSRPRCPPSEGRGGHRADRPGRIAAALHATRSGPPVRPAQSTPRTCQPPTRTRTKLIALGVAQFMDSGLLRADLNMGRRPAGGSRHWDDHHHSRRPPGVSKSAETTTAGHIPACSHPTGSPKSISQTSPRRDFTTSGRKARRSRSARSPRLRPRGLVGRLGASGSWTRASRRPGVARGLPRPRQSAGRRACQEARTRTVLAPSQEPGCCFD